MSSPVTNQLLEQTLMGKFHLKSEKKAEIPSKQIFSSSIFGFFFLFSAEEPWSDAKLYQPYEAEQILLAENASCLAVKAYLNVKHHSIQTFQYNFIKFLVLI